MKSYGGAFRIKSWLPSTLTNVRHMYCTMVCQMRELMFNVTSSSWCGGAASRKSNDVVYGYYGFIIGYETNVTE